MFRAKIAALLEINYCVSLAWLHVKNRCVTLKIVLIKTQTQNLIILVEFPRASAESYKYLICAVYLNVALSALAVV